MAASFLGDKLRFTETYQRHGIVPIEESMSIEDGFLAIIHACQSLQEKNDDVLVVGIAGPAGVGKTFLTDKIQKFMPVAVLEIDHFIEEGSREPHPNTIAYHSLFEKIRSLKKGDSIKHPILESGISKGDRKVDFPTSRIIIIEGTYALNKRVRPVIDLAISITGGLHSDFVDRIYRDVQQAHQEESQKEIAQMVYPEYTYKAAIESDLKSAHIKLINSFNTSASFMRPKFIFKSSDSVHESKIKEIVNGRNMKAKEVCFDDIYLLPPGGDHENYQSYMRLRFEDARYSILYQGWVKDPELIISPGVTFRVNRTVLFGLLSLGYTIEAIYHKRRHVYWDDFVTLKTCSSEELNCEFVQVEGDNRNMIKQVAKSLRIHHYPFPYIEEVALTNMVKIQALPENLPEFLQRQLHINSPNITLSSVCEELKRNHNKVRSGQPINDQVTFGAVASTPATEEEDPDPLGKYKYSQWDLEGMYYASSEEEYMNGDHEEGDS